MLLPIEAYASYIESLCFFSRGLMLIRQIEAYTSFIRGLSLSVKLKPMLLIFEDYTSFIQSLCSNLIILILVASTSQCCYLLDLLQGICPTDGICTLALLLTSLVKIENM
jgi:hypothetical protein